MRDDTIWDYSKIPEKKWTWFFGEDHWMDVIIGESGLKYIGTDWTCQSGGGYMGGFQTFDEFLEKGPIQKMPRDIAKEVRDHIERHRFAGGCSLKLVYAHTIDGFQLSEMYVHLNDVPIHVKKVQKGGTTTIFDGSLVAGEHVFSFVFVLKSEGDMKKIDGEVTVNVKEGKNSFTLKTTQNPKGEIISELLELE